jgi:hypothetical protein
VAVVLPHRHQQVAIGGEMHAVEGGKLGELISQVPN